MQLMLRIGEPMDRAQINFDATEAVSAYYNLAPFHKEYKPEIIKP
jgi:hypothetical protein